MSLCKYFYFVCNLERPGIRIGAIAIIGAKNESHIYGIGFYTFCLLFYYSLAFLSILRRSKRWSLRRSRPACGLHSQYSCEVKC